MLVEIFSSISFMMDAFTWALKKWIKLNCCFTKFKKVQIRSKILVSNVRSLIENLFRYSHSFLSLKKFYSKMIWTPALLYIVNRFRSTPVPNQHLSCPDLIRKNYVDQHQNTEIILPLCLKTEVNHRRGRESGKGEKEWLRKCAIESRWEIEEEKRKRETDKLLRKEIVKTWKRKCTWKIKGKNIMI